MPSETFEKLDSKKKARILQSALDCFSQHGYTKTSMDMIAEKAEIAKGALYRYFEGKKDLYLMLVDNLVNEIDQYVQKFLEEHRNHDAFSTLRDHLVSIYTLEGRFAVHNNVLCNVLYQEHLDFKGEVLAKFGRLSTYYTRLVLQRGIARGEIREDIDLDAAAFMIDSVMDRFHDGVLMEFMDHGFGLFRQPQEIINRKASQMVKAFRQAFGKPEAAVSSVHNVA
ncbi:TetR/AcrR family transcriptional regulator [bacterium]|nr:TetR/AcrR family transcriptional regulator [bacterium]